MVARSEQETVIRFAADEEHVEVYTAYSPAKARLEKAGLAPYRTTSREGEGETGWFFRVPRDLFKWRVQTPEQRKAASDRARAQFRIDSGASLATAAGTKTEEPAENGSEVDPDE